MVFTKVNNALNLLNGIFKDGFLIQIHIGSKLQIPECSNENAAAAKNDE